MDDTPIGHDHLPQSVRNAHCLDAFATHRVQQDREQITLGGTWPDTGLVFTTTVGTPINPTNMGRRSADILRRAGLRKIRFNDLRYSCASLLIDQSVNLIVSKELLEHVHIVITADVYVHVRLRLQRDAIERMSGALDEQPEP